MRAGRLRVASFVDGSVVLDVTSGRYFRARGAATHIARALAGGSAPETIATELADRFHVPRARVVADVEALLLELDRVDASRLPGNPVRFAADGDALVLSLRGVPSVRLDRDGRSLTVLTEDAASSAELARLALPHALALQGVAVLHASAVHVGRQIHAFSAASGAGKTTLARALAACGLALESEDLVVLVPAKTASEAAAPLVACGAEPMLRACAEAAVRGGRVEVPTRADLAQWRTRAPLGRVLLLAGRAIADDLSCTASGPTALCSELLGNAFAETEQTAVFEQSLETSASIARTVPGAHLVVPEGLDALARAAPRYRSITRS